MSAPQFATEVSTILLGVPRTFVAADEYRQFAMRGRRVLSIGPREAYLIDFQGERTFKAVIVRSQRHLTGESATPAAQVFRAAAQLAALDLQSQEPVSAERLLGARLAYEAVARTGGHKLPELRTIPRSNHE
jgi:hypothetical protein